MVESSTASTFADVARTLKETLSESGYSTGVIGLSEMLDKVYQNAKQTSSRWKLHGLEAVELSIIANSKIRYLGFRILVVLAENVRCNNTSVHCGASYAKNTRDNSKVQILGRVCSGKQRITALTGTGSARTVALVGLTHN